jgi:hypothetical protein
VQQTLKPKRYIPGQKDYYTKDEVLEFIIHQENELERKHAASKIAPSPATDLKDGPTTINGKHEAFAIAVQAAPPTVNLRYQVEKLEEEQQAMAEGDAALAASTLFHSDGSVDSMSLGSHLDSKDSLIVLEEDSLCKKTDLVDQSQLTSNANKTRKVLVYPFIAGELIEYAGKGLLLGEDPIICPTSHLP